MEGVWRAGRRFEALNLKWKNILNPNSSRKKFQLNSGTRLERFLAGVYDFYAFKPLNFPFEILELQVTRGGRVLRSAAVNTRSGRW